MAIAYDSFATSWVNDTVTPFQLSFNHTCTGSDRLLVVNVATNVSDSITGVTYNGVSMTLAQKQQNSGTRWLYMFYLANPASGTNTVLVTKSSSGFIEASSGSYTGVDQSSPLDAVAGTSTSGTTSITHNLTTIADNCWTISFSGIDRGGAASTGSTNRGTSGLWVWDFCDSNGVISPAGSTSMVQTYTSITANTVVGIIASFKPATASSGFAYSQSVVMV